ncbi:hypothetical protein PHMEG_00017172 [Phytophthora megakarya]|uniref:Uncharacterized protein n=1 Tax=Phytophthora megakarya TaxID=4795 RepID=A0A225VWY1_9STRA|nr:hypothetical protein PHMEG_00017172 [Phytophthora megakarya]
MTPELVLNVEFHNHLRNNTVSFLNLLRRSRSKTKTSRPWLTLSRSSTPVVTGPPNFMSCLWSEFEVLIKQLAHMTSALRPTISRPDDEMIQRNINLMDLMGSSLVCLLQVETSVMEKVTEFQIPSKC